ncbi:MAG: hypothetical protein L6R40_006840 [Gallowayella cf. fulva]|nr:MAG: hypothetical protein L6R40_006840 [Xanthomendoza cf. fulva]
MSAPNAGRQSPPPSQQPDSKIGAAGSGNIDAAPSDTHAKDKSEEAKSDGGVLSSNPEGPLEGAAHEKIRIESIRELEKKT